MVTPWDGNEIMSFHNVISSFFYLYYFSELLLTSAVFWYFPFFMTFTIVITDIKCIVRIHLYFFFNKPDFILLLHFPHTQ